MTSRDGARTSVELVSQDLTVARWLLDRGAACWGDTSLRRCVYKQALRNDLDRLLRRFPDVPIRIAVRSGDIADILQSESAGAAPTVVGRPTSRRNSTRRVDELVLHNPLTIVGRI